MSGATPLGDPPSKKKDNEEEGLPAVIMEDGRLEEKRVAIGSSHSACTFPDLIHGGGGALVLWTTTISDGAWRTFFYINGVLIWHQGVGIENNAPDELNKYINRDIHKDKQSKFP